MCAALHSTQLRNFAVNEGAGRVSKDYKATLSEMADGLEIAAEAERAVRDAFADAADRIKDGSDASEADARRFREWVEARKNEDRFNRQALAIRAALRRLQ